MARELGSEVLSVNQMIKKLVLDKEPGTTVSSLNLRKISLRDQWDAERHRPSRWHGEQANEVSQGLRPTTVDEMLRGENLCHYCSKITIESLMKAAKSSSDLSSDEYGGHHYSPQDLEASGKSCPLCDLFVRQFGGDFATLKKISSPPPVAPHWGKCRFKLWARNAQLDRRIKEESKLRLLVLEWINGGGSDILAELLITATAGSKAASVGQIVTFIYQPHADTSLNYETLMTVLRFCNDNHARCSTASLDPTASSSGNFKRQPGRPLVVSKMPSRVIVTGWEEYGRKKPFLLETRGLQGTYATLSHCWGNAALVKTTRRTLAAHLEGIDFGVQTGTRTFREAVGVCRQLGILYLWIDSLCIIQHDPDDPESNLQDWQREAGDMGRIYKDCALTIAATGASDNAANGLFGDRFNLLHYVKLPFRQKDGDEPDGEFYISLPPRGFDAEISDSRLYTRGWVLQERLLAPRYLHFGKDQWFWQCRTFTKAEVDGFEDGKVSLGADLGMRLALEGDAIKFTHWWTKIIDTYSCLSFTIATDRQVALSGLISELKKVKRQENYYGLWSDKLYIQLMWSVNSDDVNNAPPSSANIGLTTPGPESVKIMPSWSWMSTGLPTDHLKQEGSYETIPKINIPVQNDSPEHKVMRPAFEYWFIPINSQVDRIFLIIAGQLKKASIQNINNDNNATNLKEPQYVPASTFNRRGPLHKIAYGSYAHSNWQVSINATDKSLEGQQIGKAKLDRAEYQKIQACFCLRISDKCLVHKIDKTERVDKCNVLLVYPLQKSGKIAWRRIGMGFVNDVEWYDGCETKKCLLI